MGLLHEGCGSGDHGSGIAGAIDGGVATHIKDIAVGIVFLGGGIDARPHGGNLGLQAVGTCCGAPGGIEGDDVGTSIGRDMGGIDGNDEARIGLYGGPDGEAGGVTDVLNRDTRLGEEIAGGEDGIGAGVIHEDRDGTGILGGGYLLKKRAGTASEQDNLPGKGTGRSSGAHGGI